MQNAGLEQPEAHRARCEETDEVSLSQELSPGAHWIRMGGTNCRETGLKGFGAEGSGLADPREEGLITRPLLCPSLQHQTLCLPHSCQTPA